MRNLLGTTHDFKSALINKLPLFLLGLLLITGLSYRTVAQAVYGGISGTVTDEKAATIVGATVHITDLTKNVTKTVATNESGNYEVRSLIPGKYQVKVEQQGYKSSVQEVEVRADVTATTDVVLEVGAVSEIVTVSSETLDLTLKTDRADVSTSFTAKQLTELPIFNRNFTEVLLASPGTQKLAWQHAASENPQGSTQTMVNGQHFSGTSYQLDGTDNRDPILGIIVINPTLEGISEAKVTTQNFDAEFGMATAGVVTAQTRSGSNDPHGSAFIFRRNDILQARDPFSQSVPDPLIPGNRDNGQPRLIPESLWSQFGGSFGWKILRDKSFIFGDYQGTRSKEGASVRTTVPILAARAPNAAGFFDLSAYPRQIYNPQTGDPNGANRTPFAGNLIPAALVPLQARALINLFPVPNGPGINDNFSTSGTDNFDADQFNIRGDHYWSKDLHLFARYSFAKYKRAKPGAFGESLGGPALSGARFAGTSKVKNQSWAAGFDQVISPTVIWDFRFGYFKYKVDVLPGGFGTTPATDIGIPGLNLDDFTSGMPWFDIQGVGGFDLGFALGLDNGCNCPLAQEETQFQFANNLTLLRGDHTFRFGADLRWAKNLRVPSDAHRAGQVHFNEPRTGVRETPTAPNFVGGLGIATLLLGDVTNFERYVSTRTDAREHQRRWFFYGQDTWKATPRLTLNGGLRWELIFPETVDEPGEGSLLSLETGELLVGNVGDVDSAFNVKPTYGAIAPRLGIAYQWSDKTVIRAGYGRSFDVGVFGSIFGHAVTQNLPVLAFQNNDGNDWERVFTLASGPSAPVFPTVPANGRLPLPLGIEGRARPSKMRLPTLDAWNVTLQHQFGRNTSFEVGYVGNKGTHVFAGDGPAYNANAPVNNPNILDEGPRRPFFSRFGWTQNITYYGNDADNHYNSLQTKFETRFAGLILLTHYTLSAARNYSDNYFIHDRSIGYGPTSFDRKHHLSLSQVWELPFGHGKKYMGSASRAANLLVGGWQISSNTVISSGLAFTANVSGTNCSVNAGPCRPDLVGEAIPDNQDRNQWFIPAQVNSAGAIIGGPWAKAAAGQFGNVGSNTLRGPGFWQSNLAVFKKFRVTESSIVEFRAEGYNIFNHVNLGQPRDCVDCNPAEAGRIFNLASGAQMRNFQFGLRFVF
ncbi:MAG TPA: TonB-dependent receptor [Pyrinomonadaceae bacterium]|nr:TonB-dependent receptor [Pyrinomonadaceae bacterium]